MRGNRKIGGGIAGKILRVDLTTGKISTERTETYAERFIGGRGINDLILLNEMSPGTKWSDPENLLCFGAGALDGTLAPGACRVSVDTKNVFNNAMGSANVGGHWGPELKYAGFDNIVISGKSEQPVYLWIHDGNAELRDAKSVWGRTTYETERMLKKELGDDRIEFATTGPAGENLVHGSGVVIDCGKIASGSGVGCVMGTKKLKTIAVRGHGSIRLAQPQRFMDAVNTCLAKVAICPNLQKIRAETLTGVSYSPKAELWDRMTPVRNGQDEAWPMEKRKRITGDAGVRKYRQRIYACFNCPIGCMPYSDIREGDYQIRGPGFWINSVWSWASMIDLTDPEAALYAHLRSNQLGLDGDTTSVSIAWAMECYEKGLLTKKDTDGLDLSWGNAEAVVRLVDKIAYREGFGDFLAEGVAEAARKLGKGSENFALTMKGQDTIDVYRIAKGWGLAVSTSPVAGRHLRGSISRGPVGPKDQKGVPAGLTPDWDDLKYEDKPKHVFWQARAKGIEDMTGVCNYVGTWYAANALYPEDEAALVSSAFGIDLTADEFMFIAQRLYNLEKAFNTIHADFDRKDDFPPERYMNEPVKSGPYKGQICDRQEWNRMLDQFYELHGWHKETGRQTQTGLRAIGLKDVASKLAEVGKLIEE